MVTEMPLNVRNQYPFQAHYLKVNERIMHYLDEGDGEPILLLHGNPTWTFLYRKFIPILVEGVPGGESGLDRAGYVGKAL